MAGLVGRLAGLDAQCVQLHRLPAHHGAEYAGVLTFSLTEVTAVFTITLWVRLIGATASGWLVGPHRSEEAR